MSCTSPRTVWWSKKLNDNGNKTIVFNDAFSDGEPPFKIPCGQCTDCRIRKGSDWTSRLVHESKFHLVSSFLTMTYDDAHLPEHETLVPRDMQLFVKRVRKHYPGVKLRYFGVGEYGEKTHRPHYHMILFGAAFLEDRRPHSKNSAGDQLYTSATLEKLWGKGHCLIGNVSPQSCGYVAQYAFKKINGKLGEEHYRRVDPRTGETWVLQKEFANMSTHPGIGYEHYARYANQMFQRGSIIENGKEKAIPKYYDRKLMQDDPLRMESIKTGRFEDAQLRKSEQTPERLAVREEILKARRKEHRKDTL